MHCIKGKGNVIFFPSRMGHWSLWSCSQGDLRQRQWQRYPHQLGSMPNCRGNSNNTVFFAFAVVSVNEPLRHVHLKCGNGNVNPNIKYQERVTGYTGP